MDEELHLRGVDRITPLEVMAREVIPAVADLGGAV
jgi:hypothetical protein